MHTLKHLLFIIIQLFLLSSHTQAQAPQLDWVKSMGNVAGDEQGKSILIDSNRSVIVAGEFNNTVDFDAGSGVSNMVSEGGMDIFITKYDTSGQFIWSRQLGGIRDDYATCIKMDQAGNLFMVGSFQGKVDFDPGPAAFYLTSTCAVNDFILKMDNNGNFIWAKQLLANNIKTFDIDRSGNLLLGGNFGGTQDFDPGSGTYTVTANSDAQDMFLLKLNNAGDFAWMKQFKNPGQSYVQEFGLETDTNNNIYFAGCFTATMNFNPGSAAANLSSNGADDAFLLKLDAQGELKWVKRFGGDGSDKIFGIAIDNEGSVYSTGQFAGLVDFNPGTPVYNLDAQASYLCAFISKLDKEGNFVYAKQLKGGTSLGQSIALDSARNVYVAGGFYDDVDFNPGAAVFNLSGGNLFTVKLDRNASFCWATAYSGGNFFSIFSAIKVDIFKNVYTTGSFPGTVDFDPNTAVDNITATGGWDIYIHKLSQGRSINRISAEACSEYILNNIVYNKTGTYYQSLANAAGGDSTIELHLSIKKKFNLLQVNSCGPYRWKGNLLASGGTYTDTIHIPDGCDSVVELHLVINENPSPKFGRDTTLCKGESIVLSPGTYKEYSWSDKSISDRMIVKEPGTYWVKVTANNGCSANDTIHVTPTTDCTSFYIPNAFTPNNDGLNDYFKPAINYPVDNYTLQVYNRWGQIIFTSNDPKKGWDGTSKSLPETTGAFIYMIQFKYKDLLHSYKGSLMLMR